MTLHIVAFMGRAESGKSTAAQILRDAYDDNNYAVIEYSFAEPLKQACYNIFSTAYGVPKEAFFGTQEQKLETLEEYGVKYYCGRTVLQHIGTEGFRHVAPDVWVKYLTSTLEVLEHDLAELGDDPDHVIAVVTDCRFLNEVAALQKIGGKVIKLTRNSDTKNAGIPGHASEMEMDLVRPDFQIDNRDNTLKEFAEDVRTLMRIIIEESKTENG